MQYWFIVSKKFSNCKFQLTKSSSILYFMRASILEIIPNNIQQQLFSLVNKYQLMRTTNQCTCDGLTTNYTCCRHRIDNTHPLDLILTIFSGYYIILWQNKMDSTQVDPANMTYLFPFEKSHDERAFDDYMRQHWADSFVYSCVYLIVVFGCQFYMVNRRRFELRPYLTFWSGLLALFSIVGTIRTLPELIWSLSRGFEYSCCSSSFMGQGKVTSFWTYLFVVSKVFELGDTVFIVLRKQPLIFLHWYHHTTVLMYAWYSYHERISTGRWFIVMNYSVHSLMYSYYALRAMKYQLPRWVNMFITSLQLVQMLVGIVVNIVAYNALSAGRECDSSFQNIKYALLMYFSYLVLFSHFFYNTYIVKKPVAHAKKHWWKYIIRLIKIATLVLFVFMNKSVNETSRGKTSAIEKCSILYVTKWCHMTQIQHDWQDLKQPGGETTRHQSAVL